MNIATVTTNAPKKGFSFSYSKLKNFETCPKRSWHLDHARDIKEEESEHITYGTAVHKALADAVSGKAALPEPYTRFQEWVDRITGGVIGQVLVEQQLAITRAFAPTTWFGRDAWFRGIADVIKLVGPVAVVLDYKTGKIQEDGVQLALMAACVFAHHPDVQKIRTEFVWLKEGATTRADFARTDMPRLWANVLPRVQLLEKAVETTTFPAKPGNLCRRYCPVRSCPHHGV